MNQERKKNITKIICLMILTFFHAELICQTGSPVVVFPNGGQTLTVGSTVTITWSGTALGTVVGIDYTIDNWVNTTWLNTNFSNPTANSFTWVVPNTPGTQCKVGIFDTSFQGDISDNFFTIAPAAATAPIADFIYTGAPCSNKTISFSDASSNSPNSWNWSVTPSATVTNIASQNPGILFGTPGIYSVTLISSNSGGSSAPVTKTISINPSPTIHITSSASVICKGQTVSLTAGGASNYLWNTGVSGASITLSPTTTTTYSVTGTNTNNCSSTTTHMQNVNACTHLPDINSDSGFISVFPNPAKDIVTVIGTNTPLDGIVVIDVYSSDGKLIQSNSLSPHQNTISLRNLKPGFYFINRTVKGQSVKTAKLIVE